MTRTYISLTRIALLVPALLTGAHANNVRISNVELKGQLISTKSFQIEFDVAWDNSWRTSTHQANWDGVWIFAKWRLSGSNTWRHCHIDNVGFARPAGSTLDPTNANAGAYLYRESDGVGNVSYPDVQLRWKYEIDGTALFPDDANVDVSVHAIEMVHIPTGGFWVGDGSGTSTGRLQAGNSGLPFFIGLENISFATLGGTDGTNLSSVGVGDDFDASTTVSLQLNYPKGYSDFYIMKYELSMGQYTDFLNHLTPVQAANRFHSGFVGIANNGSPEEVYVCSSPERACNFLGWADVCAYADWSGLRPMSELEYEKAARGTRAPVPGEYAWGDSTIAQGLTYSFSGSGTANELITNPATSAGNAILEDLTGNNVPRRCGIVAASAMSPTRRESGASYYGVMEMSGNVREPVATLGTAEGRTMIAYLGDGELDTAGNSDVNWPEDSGVGYRGGAVGSSLETLRVSDRSDSPVQASGANRVWANGCRLVRLPN